MGWLCRETDHVRFDDPWYTGRSRGIPTHPRPEADPVEVVDADQDQEASMTSSVATDTRVRADERLPDCPPIDDRLLRLDRVVNRRRGLAHACVFCAVMADCPEDH